LILVLVLCVDFCLLFCLCASNFCFSEASIRTLQYHILSHIDLTFCFIFLRHRCAAGVLHHTHFQLCKAKDGDCSLS
jgi:hypothetical protein